MDIAIMVGAILQGILNELLAGPSKASETSQGAPPRAEYPIQVLHIDNNAVVEYVFALVNTVVLIIITIVVIITNLVALSLYMDSAQTRIMPGSGNRRITRRDALGIRRSITTG